MSTRPVIFVSAVSKELRSARDLVARTLRLLGFDPVIQNEFGTETGKVRDMLSDKIQPCAALIQLVGHALGGVVKEARRVSEVMSYTQFEAHFAEQNDKPVWYLLIADIWRPPFLDADGNPLGPETQDETDDQRAYRRKIKASPDLYHTLADEKELELAIFKMLPKLDTLREHPTYWLSNTDPPVPSAPGAAPAAALTKEDVRQLFDEYVEKVRPLRQETDAQKEEASEDALIAQLARTRGQSTDDLRRLINQTAIAVQEDTTEPAIERARAAFARREYGIAEALALKAAKASHQDSDQGRHQRSEAFKLAGDSAREQIHYDQALEHYRAAAALTSHDPDALTWLDLQNDITWLYFLQGRHKEFLNQAQSIWKAALQSGQADAIAVLTAHRRYGVALIANSQSAAAETEYRALIPVQERVLGAEHPETLSSRNNLANALDSQAKYADAEREHRAVLEVRERVLGAEHPNTLTSRMNLANALYSQAKYAEAEQEHRAVLKVRERVLGAEHPDTLMSRMNLGSALYDQGKHAEAEQEHRAVLKIQERVLGAEHPHVALSCFNLALCLEAQKQLPEALAFMQRAELVWTKALVPDHSDTKDAKCNRERLEAAVKAGK